MQRKRLDVDRGRGPKRLQGMLDEFLSVRARRPELDLQPTWTSSRPATVRSRRVHRAPEMREQLAISLKFVRRVVQPARVCRSMPTQIARSPGQPRCATHSAGLRSPGDEVLVGLRASGDCRRGPDPGDRYRRRAWSPDVLDQVFRALLQHQEGRHRTRAADHAAHRRASMAARFDRRHRSSAAGTQFTMSLPIRAPAPRLGVDVGTAADRPDVETTDDPWEDL